MTMKKAAPSLMLLILFAFAAWYFFTGEPDAIHELPPPSLSLTEPADEPPAVPGGEWFSTQAEAEPVDITNPLPRLDASDPEITGALIDIAGDQPLADYLVSDHIISRIVATVDSLTSRQVPAQINPIEAASGKFVVDAEGKNMVMSAKNFARYDGYVALVRALDADDLATLYRRFYPLFQQAWEDNGGEGPFNQRLLQVIDHLLNTAAVTGPVYMTKPEAVYLFEDTGLEAMTAGQKILLRIGSDHAAVVKAKLTGLRSSLQASGG